MFYVGVPVYKPACGRAMGAGRAVPAMAACHGRRSCRRGQSLKQGRSTINVLIHYSAVLH